VVNAAKLGKWDYAVFVLQACDFGWSFFRDECGEITPDIFFSASFPERLLT